MMAPARPPALRALSTLRPLYIVPRDDLVREVLIPCLRATESFACMFGFFSSAALSDIAPGLAEFLSRAGQPMRLIVSPNLTESDVEAMKNGLRTPATILEQRLNALLGEAALSESALVRHTLQCLAYLLASERLEVKVAYLSGGIFHDKAWFFADSSGAVVVHGSSNMTVAGLRRNHEQLRVEKSWETKDQGEVVADLTEEYEALWDGLRDYAVTLALPVAIEEELIRCYKPEQRPTQEDFEAAWRHDYLRGLSSPPPQVTLLSIKAPERSFVTPSDLEWEDGDFAHQGQAVHAWEREGRRGILEMATGSGKTVTAFIAAQRLFVDLGSLLIVVAAPILPLLSQWEREAKRFGLHPVTFKPMPRSRKLAAVDSAVRRLHSDASQVECLIVTHDLLADEEFQRALRRHHGQSLVIADEVHNLGAAGFQAHVPTFFDWRLGLSATPERQYDPAGTAFLRDFFGSVVFQFTLEQAIGRCLVPYDYYVHPVELEGSELAAWSALTAKIKRLAWTQGSSQIDDADARLQLLLNRRRRILEEAESKLGALRNALLAAGGREMHHTLIYATDKGPQQLRDINALLVELKVRYHQLTARETAQGELAGQLFTDFQAGHLQVLTAKRVLDEGVDIPEVQTAFIVASTTGERQWVQRRGRVLRKCPSIGKKFAVIHDFLVVPPDDGGGITEDVRAILRAELTRVEEFARLARNAGSRDGALSVTHPLVRRFFG